MWTSNGIVVVGMRQSEAAVCAQVCTSNTNRVSVRWTGRSHEDARAACMLRNGQSRPRMFERKPNYKV